MGNPTYNYYYATNIVGKLRRKFNTKEGIDRRSVEFALDKLGIPYTISQHYRLYKKWYIDNLLYDDSKLRKLRQYMEEFNSPENLIKKDKHESKLTRDEMVKYLDSIIAEPKSSSMEDASDELLRKDDVYYDLEIDEEEQLSDVDGDWKPKEGLFTGKDPKKIANYLIRHSKDKGQAMKRLTFYMNRAGENLTNKTVLNKVKSLLKESKRITINDKIRLNENLEFDIYSRKVLNSAWRRKMFDAYAYYITIYWEQKLKFSNIFIETYKKLLTKSLKEAVNLFINQHFPEFTLKDCEYRTTPKNKNHIYVKRLVFDGNDATLLFGEFNGKFFGINKYGHMTSMWDLNWNSTNSSFKTTPETFFEDEDFAQRFIKAHDDLHDFVEKFGKIKEELFDNYKTHYEKIQQEKEQQKKKK